MPVKAHSRDDFDPTSDEISAPKGSKKKGSKKGSRARGKNAKSPASTKKQSGTDAVDTSVQLSQPSMPSTDSDLENATTPGPFSDFIIGGPSSSEPSVTKPATLPSAPLVSSSEPSLGSTQDQYSLFFVNTPVESMLKTKLPVDFGKSSKITIGRDQANAIVIPDQVVSRAHAELTFQDGRIYLRDLNSMNGTYVYDGTDFQQVMDQVEVSPGSLVRFGTSTIVKLTRE